MSIKLLLIRRYTNDCILLLLLLLLVLLLLLLLLLKLKYVEPNNHGKRQGK